MNKKYYFSKKYYVYPLTSLLAIALTVEYSSNMISGLLDPSFLTSIVFYIYLFLLIRFGTHCDIYSNDFTRISNFFLKKTIKISEITEITFSPTWIFTDEARTLTVWSETGKKITMTDMAYTRPVLIDVVNTLIKINPSIRLDKDTHLLIKRMS